MKRSYAVIWAIALFSCMLPVLTEAGTPIHLTIAKGSGCNTCHAANRTLGLTKGTVGVPIIRTSPAIYNNICQSCHRTGDGYGKNKPMALVDTSNIFGDHSTANFGNLRQTSHRWDGSDTNPAAGAQPPIQAAMTTNTEGTGNLRGRTGNQLACVRCHAVHLQNAPGAMQRMATDQSQMCVDCHRSRNQTSHTSGTHPVGVDYLAAVAKGNFNATPKNANPVNPTSDLNNYLATSIAPNKNVVCTTCHGVHYTDSRSSTFDGSSTARGRGNYTNLSTGDGYQLRTDRRGAKVAFATPTQDKLNICSNCHSNKSNHNAAGQDVQCNDCHGAHVEYDPNDPTNSKGTNVYLVRRNVKKGGMPSSIYFRYTGSQREYRNDAGTGVCQGCHNVPGAGGKYPPEHDSGKASDCNKCHFHSSPMGSFSGACGQCHSVSGGLATSTATNATAGLTGAHAAHVITGVKMECNTCHDGYAGRAMPSFTIDIGFSINGTNVPGFNNVLFNPLSKYNNTETLTPAYTGVGKGFSGAVGAGANQTCSAIYCHGATLTGGTNQTPSWVGGPSQKQCGSCHGASSALPPTTGGHARHAGAAAGQLQILCSQCHGTTTAQHVNGAVSWNMAGINGQYKTPTGRFYNVSGSTGRLAPSASWGTCTNLYCHSNGGPNGSAMVYSTVTWGGAALNCGSCHANMATTVAPNGGHLKHASTGNVGGPAYDCSVCHSGYTAGTTNGATHANSLVELITAVTGYSKGSPMPAKGAWGTCSTNLCHGQATGLSWNNGLIWQSGGDRCTTCHSSTTSVIAGTPFYSTAFPAKQVLSSDPKVGAHTYHLTNLQMMASSLNCADCHGSVALKDATHMNGVTNFTWTKFANHSGATTPSYNPVAGTCSAVYCHGAGLSVDSAVGINRTPSWKTPFMPATLTPASCKACHGFPPITATHQAFASPASFPTAACTTCHPNVSATGTTYADIFVNKALHINGHIEGGGCNGCHGYPPSNKRFTGTTNNWVDARQENYSGGGGVHTIAGHVSPTATQDQQWVNCSNCHNSADHATSPVAFNPSSNIKVTINPRFKFAADRTSKYTSNKLDGALHVPGNCSNVSCHLQKTPQW